MAERSKKNIIWRVFRWLFTVILGFLLTLDLVLVVYVTGISGTLLNPSFIESEIEKVDIYSAGKDFLAEQKDEFLGELGEEGEKIYDVVESSLSEEWMQSQIHTALSNFFSYLNKESDDLDMSFSLDGLKQNFKTSLSETIHESPPEGLKELSPEELDEYLEQAYEGIDNLPDEIRVEFGNLQALEPLRNIMGVPKLINYILIAAAVLFALLLILLHFRVKAALRAIGFPVFLGGVVALVIGIVGGSVASGKMSGMELPSPLTAEMFTTIVKDFLAAPNPFIYSLIALGFVLILVSFIYSIYRERRRPINS